MPLARHVSFAAARSYDDHHCRFTYAISLCVADGAIEHFCGLPLIALHIDLIILISFGFNSMNWELRNENGIRLGLELCKNEWTERKTSFILAVEENYKQWSELAIKTECELVVHGYGFSRARWNMHSTVLRDFFGLLPIAAVSIHYVVSMNFL